MADGGALGGQIDLLGKPYFRATLKWISCPFGINDPYSLNLQTFFFRKVSTRENYTPALSFRLEADSGVVSTGRAGGGAGDSESRGEVILTVRPVVRMNRSVAVKSQINLELNG